MSSRALALALALVVSGPMMAGCGSDAADDTPSTGRDGATTSQAPDDDPTGRDGADTAADGGSTTGGPEFGSATWAPCGPGDLECAVVEVPVDHDQPDGPTLELALNRWPAAGPAEGSIFVNPGGPGASGIDLVRSGFGLDQATMARYHLVGFDPRGVGASTSLGCEVDRTIGPLPDYSPDDEGEARALDEDARAIARACGQADSLLLANLDTASIAADLDLLRQAVGDEVLHYYGFSYGTLIGLVYADAFPDRIGHLVLDGVVDPTHTLPDLLRQQTSAFDGLFDQMEEACRSQLACPDGGIAAAYDRVMAELESSGPVGQVGPAELENATLLSLYDQSLWSPYARALTAADSGRYDTIEALSDSFTDGVSFTAYAGVECVDSPHPEGADAWDAFAAELAAISPRFGAVVANELRTCAYWPVPPVEAREPVRAVGAPPVVVIGSTNDPATPLENARRVAADLEDGRLVVVDGTFHTSYSSSACVQGLVADYFTDAGPPGAETSC
jgi:pimeloyl-ACP methyl ester carboxylesterase